MIRELDKLKYAVLAYLSECDNPVPDYGYRRNLRNRLRTLVDAPSEPALRQNEAFQKGNLK